MPSPTTAGTSSTTDYEQLTLDDAGNVTSRRLRDGTSIAFSYDHLNRVTAKDLPGSELDVSYTYDLTGHLELRNYGDTLLNPQLHAWFWAWRVATEANLKGG